MESKLLKCLLSNDFYSANKTKLSSHLFEDEAEELFEVIVNAQEKYSHDISTDELLALWKTANPVAVRAKVAAVTDVVAKIGREDALSPDIAADLLTDFWKRDHGRQIANLGVAISEGNVEAYARLNELLNKAKDGFLPDDLPPPVTKDLDELLANVSDSNRWRFNINALSSKVYGVGPGDFGIIFARPETGKTAFDISLACAPNGFCDQGARVLYAGNEEDVKRTMLRAYLSVSGMTKQEAIANPETAKKAFQTVSDNLEMQDIQGWTLDRLDALCEKYKPDIVIVDQLDKVKIPGLGSDVAGHIKLREIYLQSREMAKNHKMAFLANSQASVDGEKKTVLTPDMMEGSKTGKYAEADLIIGIGKYSIEDTAEGDPLRFLTVGKNKISGWHGTVACNLDGQTSRYID